MKYILFKIIRHGEIQINDLKTGKYSGISFSNIEDFYSINCPVILETKFFFLLLLNENIWSIYVITAYSKG